MRSEKEIMNLIIEKAKQDDRILAAYMKGSRTNPKVPKDIYRDFDIMYVVKETESFMLDTSWIDFFGKVVLKQEQDDDYGYGERFGIRSNYSESYSWLLLFSDGNRIDVGIETVNALEKGKNRNKLYLPLIDKIGCLPELPPPIDEGFSVSTGKLNKYFKKYLPETIYQRYLKTYTDGEYDHFWCEIRAAVELFHDIGVWVGEKIKAPYPYADEEAAYDYMKHIRDDLLGS